MIEEHVQISNIYCYIYVSPFIVTLVLPVFHMSLKLTCYCALNRVWSGLHILRSAIIPLELLLGL